MTSVGDLFVMFTYFKYFDFNCNCFMISFYIIMLFLLSTVWKWTLLMFESSRFVQLDKRKSRWILLQISCLPHPCFTPSASSTIILCNNLSPLLLSLRYLSPTLTCRPHKHPIYSGHVDNRVLFSDFFSVLTRRKTRSFWNRCRSAYSTMSYVPVEHELG